MGLLSDQAADEPFGFFWVAGALILAISLVIRRNYRWQWVPIFIAIVLETLLYIILLLSGWEPQVMGLVPTVIHFISLILFLLSVLSVFLFPLFEPPVPAGKYLAGICEFHLQDKSGREPRSENPEVPREMMVTAWYPAGHVGNTQPEPFFRFARVIGSAVAKSIGLPGFIFNHLGLINSHSYLDAELSNNESQYPVLIFSHGYMSYASQNSLLMEHLASHGYIAFSLTHPYDTAAIRYSESRVLYGVPEPDEKQTGKSEKDDETLKFLFDALMADDDLEFEQQMLRYIESSKMFSEACDRWVDDTRFFVDELEKVDEIHPAGRFTGKMNLEQLGVFGMSLGGSAAGKFASIDGRCKAGINLDGLFYDNSMDIQIYQPFMIMYSDPEENERKTKGVQFDRPIKHQMNDFVYKRARGDIYSILVKHSTHINFSDLAIIAPCLKWFGVLGRIDGNVMNEIVNTCVLEFFNKYLLKQESAFLDSPKTVYAQVESKKKEKIKT